MNAITAIDGYKTSHAEQYPKGMTRCYSNFTPRSTRYLPKTEENTDDGVVFLGSTYFMKWYLQENFNRNFFSIPKETAVRKFERLMKHYLGDAAPKSDRIAALHDLQYLPITIRALDEGLVVPAGVPVLTIENTIDEFYWIPNYLETILSCMLWTMSTNASIARKYKMLLTKYAKETGGAEWVVPFQAHDFSFRGMSSPQSAEMSGFAHLTSFTGTDTIPALEFAEEYYGANLDDKDLIGCSVPATEHSVMCAGGADDEYETYRRLIEEIHPKGIVSIVSDTWDYFKVLTDILPRLKDKIVARVGKVVIRPDSGDPYRIIVGYFPEEVDYAKYLNGGEIMVKATGKVITPEEYAGSMVLLEKTFGSAVNEKGYKELHPAIGLIYGDSITLSRCENILNGLKRKGFASTNVVFGVGSFTYQYQSRDTAGFAMKATAVTINGEERAIFKNPKTDGGTKKSAKGYLAVFRKADGTYTLVDGITREISLVGELKEIYRDGKILRTSTLKEIRERINESITFK